MTKRKIQIGILGCGGYGRTARSFLNNAGESDIVACMDVDPEVARAAAEEEGAKDYTDLDALLAHPGMEAVCINTPVLLHAEHSRASLEAGKHVFITKPVTNSVKSANEVVDLAKQQNLVYMVAHHARHADAYRFLHALADEGKIGRVCNVFVTCCSSSGLEQQAGDWRVEAGRNPGGPLLQCGIHLVDVLIAMFGEIESVSSMMQEDITPFDVVDNTVNLIRMANGIQVAFMCNYTTAYLHTFDVMGTEGNLHHRAHIAALGAEEVYFQGRKAGPHEPWEQLTIPRDDTYPDSHGGVLEREFASQIRAARPDYLNAEQAIMALQVVEGLVESHRNGRVVRL